MEEREVGDTVRKSGEICGFEMSCDVGGLARAEQGAGGKSAGRHVFKQTTLLFT